MHERHVTVDGLVTRYFEAGSGEPLVLVHGGEIGVIGGAGALLWDRNIAGLAAHFRVIAVDRLGEGKTENPRREEDYTAEAVLRHLYEFLRALGLARAHLVGQSRGAYWITRLALEHPEIVKTLVICNSATLAPEGTDSALEQRRAEIFAAMPEALRDAITYRWSALSYTSDHLTNSFVDALVELAQQPKNRAAATTMARLRATQWLPTLERQKTDTLRRIEAGELRAPTLVVWSTHDRQATLASGLALFELVASSSPAMTRMYIMNRAGHFHFREYPDEFNGVVTEFLRTT
jgi:2-hydroxy-6-oxonona-2,4-dienedioate hydrolase